MDDNQSNTDASFALKLSRLFDLSYPQNAHSTLSKLIYNSADEGALSFEKTSEGNIAVTLHAGSGAYLTYVSFNKATGATCRGSGTLTSLHVLEVKKLDAFTTFLQNLAIEQDELSGASVQQRIQCTEVTVLEDDSRAVKGVIRAINDAYDRNAYRYT